MSPSCFGIEAVSALWLSRRSCPYFRVVSASWLFRPESPSCLWSVDMYVIADSAGSAKKQNRNLKHSTTQACICKPYFSCEGSSFVVFLFCGYD